MAFIRWNELNNRWEIATNPNSPTSAFTNLPIANPVNALDTANKQYVDSVAGGVAGPAVSTDNSVALFNGTTGKIIKDQTMATIVGRLMKLQTGYPSLSFFDNNGTANQRYWKFETAADTFYLMGVNDADTAVVGGRWTFYRNGMFDVSGALQERGRTVPLGEWIIINPTLFTDTGSISGGTRDVQYTLIGRTMLLNFVLSSFTLTGPPGEVRMSLPVTVVANNRSVVTISYHNGTIWTTALAYAVNGETFLRIGGTNFVVGTGLLWGTAIISI